MVDGYSTSIKEDTQCTQETEKASMIYQLSMEPRKTSKLPAVEVISPLDTDHTSKTYLNPHLVQRQRFQKCAQSRY